MAVHAWMAFGVAMASVGGVAMATAETQRSRRERVCAIDRARDRDGRVGDVEERPRREPRAMLARSGSLGKGGTLRAAAAAIRVGADKL